MDEGSDEETEGQDREGVRADDAEVRLPLIYDDCKITEDEDGTKHASSINGVMTVLPDGESKLFMRNAIKIRTEGKSSRHRMLVGELDGVRVYALGDRIIITKRDLYF